jgi:hypothetical protein
MAQSLSAWQARIIPLAYIVHVTCRGAQPDNGPTRPAFLGAVAILAPAGLLIELTNNAQGTT